MRLLGITERAKTPLLQRFSALPSFPMITRIPHPVVTRWFRGSFTMASKQITKRLIDGLKPRASEYFVWDGSLAGYGVRVQTTGAMSYVVKYRAGSGRAAPTRRLTLAKIGTLTPDEARTLARKTLGSVLPTVPIPPPSGPLTSAHPPLRR